MCKVKIGDRNIMRLRGYKKQDLLDALDEIIDLLPPIEKALPEITTVAGVKAYADFMALRYTNEVIKKIEKQKKKGVRK